MGGVGDDAGVGASGAGRRAAGGPGETLLGAGLDAVEGGAARRVGGGVLAAFAELLGDGVAALVPVPFVGSDLLVQVQLPGALTVRVRFSTHQEIRRRISGETDGLVNFLKLILNF